MRIRLFRRFLAIAVIAISTSSAIASPRNEWSDWFLNPLRHFTQQIRRLLPTPTDDPAPPKP